MFARIRSALFALCVVVWSFGLITPAAAQCPAKTTVADTLYNADGSLASGRVTIAWPTFLIGTCQVIGGQSSVTIANGALTVQLYPNTTAVPAGTSYRVTFALKSGRISTEYWVVPASAAPVVLATVRAPTVPVPAVMFAEAQVTNLVADLHRKIELPSICPSGKILESNGSSTSPQVDCVDPPSGGSGTQHQVNGASLASNNPVNFQDSASLGFSNPSAGIVQASVKDGVITAAKLNASSPSSAQLSGIGDNNIAAGAISPNRVAGTAVVQTRSLSTASPLSGGGDLSADRTIACPTCENTANKSVAGGYAGLDAGSRIAKAQGHSATLYSDQSNTYSGATTQDMSTITAVKLPAAAGAAPAAGGDVRYDSTRAATVAGGNQSTTGFFPRVLKMTNCTTEANCSSASGGNQVDAASGAQGVNETNFASNWSMPANFLFTNKSIQVCISFQITTSGSAPTLVLRLKTGSTVLFANSAIATANSMATKGFGQCYVIQGTAAAGASVSVETGSMSHALHVTGSNQSNSIAQPVSGIATNGALTIQVSAQWGTATSGNTIQLHQFFVMEMY